MTTTATATRRFTPADMAHCRPLLAPVEAPADPDAPITLSSHARWMAARKGFAAEAVLAAANDAGLTYQVSGEPDQRRHIAGGLVAVVDTYRRVVVTVYAHGAETPLRADQDCPGCTGETSKAVGARLGCTFCTL